MQVRLIDSCQKLFEKIRAAVAEHDIEVVHDTHFDPEGQEWLGEQSDLIVIGDYDDNQNPGSIQKACWPTPVVRLSNQVAESISS